MPFGRALSSIVRNIRNAWSQPPFWANDGGLIFGPMIGEKEHIGTDYAGYIQGIYKANGPIFGLILARALLFSEARFLWRRFDDGRPGELFGDEQLALLGRPWPNGTTGEMLFQMEQDASLAGNSYWVRVAADGSGPERLRRLRPDWVSIVTGSPTEDPFDYRALPIAYVYKPRAGLRGGDGQIFTPDQVIHYSPLPDPDAQWLGMSWLSPVIDEIKADKSATKHKLRYFEAGTTLGVVVTYDKTVPPDWVEQFKREFDKEYAGTGNAYKNIHIGGGSDVKTVGANLQQLEFKLTQGAGETRLAQAARVPVAIAGFSEGNAGSALNASTFGAQRRLFADGWGRPHWRIAASSIESIFDPPENAHLWYDARDVSFLREDAIEEAAIFQANADAISTLWSAGFEADSVVEAVRTGDLKKLVHSGAESVQTQSEKGEGLAQQMVTQRRQGDSR